MLTGQHPTMIDGIVPDSQHLVQIYSLVGRHDFPLLVAIPAPTCFIG
jgi:hypothetical protein